MATPAAAVGPADKKWHGHSGHWKTEGEALGHLIWFVAAANGDREPSTRAQATTLDSPGAKRKRSCLVGSGAKPLVEAALATARDEKRKAARAVKFHNIRRCLDKSGRKALGPEFKELLLPLMRMDADERAIVVALQHLVMSLSVS